MNYSASSYKASWGKILELNLESCTGARWLKKTLFSTAVYSPHLEEAGRSCTEQGQPQLPNPRSLAHPPGLHADPAGLAKRGTCSCPHTDCQRGGGCGHPLNSAASEGTAVSPVPVGKLSPYCQNS